jgi:acyl carrier protein
MDDNIFKKVVNIIYDQTFLEKDDIKLTTHIYDDLGLDSLDAVEIICAIEEEFDIEISDSEADGLKTIEELVLLIDSKN